MKEEYTPKRLFIESIEPIEGGSKGFHRALLSEENGHSACIDVIGKSLTECVERTIIIINAFKREK